MVQEGSEVAAVEVDGERDDLGRPEDDEGSLSHAVKGDKLEKSSEHIHRPY